MKTEYDKQYRTENHTQVLKMMTTTMSLLHSCS